MTRTQIQQTTGSGGADDEPDSQLEQLSGAMSEDCTIGEEMRRQNLEQREKRRQNMQANNAKGVGSLAGLAQAWVDRVGQDGMKREASDQGVIVYHSCCDHTLLSTGVIYTSRESAF